MERLAPPSEKRFVAMEEFVRADIVTAACMMSILPGLEGKDWQLPALLGIVAVSVGAAVAMWRSQRFDDRRVG